MADDLRASPIPLLFLVADTGAGHRAAAQAVAEALEAAYPRRFAPVWCDPLTGPGSALLRRVSGLYGPVVRLAPWAWGAAWHLSNRRPIAGLLQRTLFALADQPVADAVRASRPAVIASFHPLTGHAAVRARDRAASSAPVVAVVTDLVTAHASWRQGAADRIVVPSAAALRRFDRGAGAGRCVQLGLPVAAGFTGGPLPAPERAALRRALGLPAAGFVVLVVGGGEGCGGIGNRAAAIIRHLPGIQVAAVCGRNRRARRTLTRLAARAGGRVVVQGFVSNLADWLRCADLVVTKAGPGVIAEAACCGTPMLLTSHLPGQERGNTEFAVAAGAGREARRVRDMILQIGRLHRDPAALEQMRAGCATLARPAAAAGTAELIARLAGGSSPGSRPPDQRPPGTTRDRREVRMRSPLTASRPQGGASIRGSVRPGARIRHPARPLTGRWAGLPVEPAGDTMLGISFRPLQAESLGLQPRAALASLLTHPFQVVRLAAYWDRMEPGPGSFEPGMLDWQVEAAERAGKKIIICVGAVKAFGYPEFFVPPHRLGTPLPEGSLVTPEGHPALAGAAAAFVTRVVRRYRERPSIMAWQVEHEAVDPLGMEHSWRLSAGFAEHEVAAARAADPARPILMNGFLPTSLPVRLHQWWRTRDQGESLSVAQRLADVVGIDYYPRHALMPLGSRTLYLDGSRNRWQLRRRARLQQQAASSGQRLMIAEGQAEPWETVTTPPSPAGRGMYSCLPEHVIGNYNACIRASRQVPGGLWAYLFWGAEYWLLRERDGDPRYLHAAARVFDGA